MPKHKTTCSDHGRPHSVILASCKPGCKPGLQPGFRQVRAGLRHAFDQLWLFCRKPGREAQQVRWFVRVLDKWNVQKTCFKQVRSWLSTCFRPGLQLARITEFGLIGTGHAKECQRR